MREILINKCQVMALRILDKNDDSAALRIIEAEVESVMLPLIDLIATELSDNEKEYNHLYHRMRDIFKLT